MTELNEAIRSITGTDEDQRKTFSVDLSGHSWEGGISDHVIEGRYLLRVSAARYVPQKNGVGVNIRLVYDVVGPEGCSEVGKNLITYHPIKPGDSADPEVAKKNAFIQNAVASMLDFGGEYRKGIIENLSPPAMVNAYLAAWVTERKLPARGDNPERVVGDIRAYLSKEKYEKAPGPTTGRAKDASEIALSGKSNGGGQAQVPVKAQAADVASGLPVTGGSPGADPLGYIKEGAL